MLQGTFVSVPNQHACTVGRLAPEASEEELWKCIHFHFASICMPTARPSLLFGERGEFMLESETVFSTLPHMGMVEAVILIPPSFLLG